MKLISNKLKITAIFMAVLIISIPVIAAEELNLVYDANGNLVSGDGFVREYNGLNQLVRVKNGSGNTLEEFVWHPIEEKILIKKIYNSSNEVAQRITYVNENTVKIKNSSGTFYEHYVYQDGVLVAQRDADGNKQAIHPDIIGSANVVTDSSGNVLETNFVSPFGEPIIGGETTRFDYTGKEYDKLTKEHDFKARQYKSEWGRFIVPDTFTLNAYNPQDLNRNSYVRNNPYFYVDPNGKWAIAVGGGVEGGMGLGAGAQLGIAVSYSQEYGWQAGVFVSGGSGVVYGADVGGGLSATIYPFAEKLEDLEGMGVSGTASLGLGPHGSLGVDLPTELNARGFGITGSVGGGAGIDFTVLTTLTVTSKAVNIGTLARTYGYISYVNTNVQNQNLRNSLFTSILNTALSGNNVRWYYNPTTGNYQYWAGSGKPSNSDVCEVGKCGSGSSGGGGGGSNSNPGSYGTCRATGNAQCPRD
ncbi:MAG: hypothetical protein HY361_03610 [Candidatus Aenigmarchaeota archaeon]|nr:hypothetical protein [Candidatus Aenigmarchaeota archaeon]